MVFTKKAPEKSHNEGITQPIQKSIKCSIPTVKNGVSGNNDFPHFTNETLSSVSCANLFLDGTISSSNWRKK